MITDDPSTPALPTVVLIHGLWMTPRSWAPWVRRYEKAGHVVVAPSWPGLEGEVEAIRRDPSPLRSLRVETIVEHYARIIRGIDGPVILMGHSFGGLFVQLLLDRGLGDAGVAIDPAQPAGFYALPFSTLKAGSPVLANPFTIGKAVPLTPAQFNYAFTNELSAEESRTVYDELHIPAAATVLWQGAAGIFGAKATKVDYRNGDRAPLLIIAGGADHIVPASINRANARKYRRSTAVTEYREFPGRTHNTVGQAGWEAVADEAIAWAVAHVTPS